MDPRARNGAAQTLSPRRRARQPSPPGGSGGAPASRGKEERQSPDSPPMPPKHTMSPRARLPHRQRRHAAPATPVPIAPPKVEPLSSRPVPRPRASPPERTARPAPSPPFSPPEHHSFELSSSMSSSSSLASSASSLLTVLADEDETCESSLSEPDLGFEDKRGLGGEMVTVPTGVRVKEFVGEGSANVVVGIELPEGTPMATRRFFEGKLLRLQKISDNPEKRPYPYPEQYRYWCENIKPFFSEKDDLVSVDLVHLGPGAPQLLDDVSDLLRQLDGAAPESDPDAERPESSRLPGLSEHLSKRREKFWGSRLARVEYGMLVDDMRVGEEDGVMIEIKPKWLFQSPSAPHAALRCRTCAVRLHRRLRDPAYDAADLPCPLLMASDDWEDRSSFVSALLPEHEQSAWYVAALARWFKATPTQSRPKRLIAHLRGVQQALDAKGPLVADALDEDFRLAMTLRDCSIFLRVLRRQGQAPKVVAKIADLDKKNSAAKSAYWRRTEAELVHGGAYAAAYRVDAEKGAVVPLRTGCLVERGLRASQWREFEARCGEGDHNRLLTEGELTGYLR